MRKILSVGKYSMDKELLGIGNFGRVELATHVLTNIKVAIKIIDTRKMKTTYASRNLYREARILAQIRHPNIVRMYETLKASYLYCIVLAYIPHPDLANYLSTLPRSRMSEADSWKIVRQLTSALLFLHQHNMVHRDLKMNNILVDAQKGNIKIIDFGLSNRFAPGELLKTHCGSPEFAAPELFYDRHDYGPEVDAWSFGVIVYGILVGKLPFVPGSTEPSKRHALLRMLNKGLTSDHRSQMLHLSVDCRGMLFQLIEPNPELRLGIDKVCDHVWITRDGRFPLSCDEEPEVDKPLQAKVISKLAELHRLDAEYIESIVSKYKYDSFSSQFNMLMDHYSQLRREKKITNIKPLAVRRVKPPGQPSNGNGGTNPSGKTCSKRPSVSASRMKAILECKTKDDSAIGLIAADNIKRLCSTTLKEEGRLNLALRRPTITVSICPESNSSSDSLDQCDSKSNCDCVEDGGAEVSSYRPITIATSESLHTNISQLEAENSHCQTLSSASTANLQELQRKDSDLTVDIARPATSSSHGMRGKSATTLTSLCTDETNAAAKPKAPTTRVFKVHQIKMSNQPKDAVSGVRKLSATPKDTKHQRDLSE